MSDKSVTILQPKRRDLGGFTVKRVLPQIGCRMIGPFIFVDQMGPAEFAAGTGVDVRPHPHIGLATVTYIFRGSMMHRDSLGSHQLIEPGAINWMTAGSGIVHSERTPMSVRSNAWQMDGLQCWVALPRHAEETKPSFVHHPADSMPTLDDDGATVRVLVGKIFDKTSPVVTHSDTLYLDVRLKKGKSISIPTKGREVGIMPVEGRVKIAGRDAEMSSITVSRHGEPVTVTAEVDSRVMVLGGEPLGESREIWWNFVSSSKERIEQAKADWATGRFPIVPGDEKEFTPLPER